MGEEDDDFEVEVKSRRISYGERMRRKFESGEYNEVAAFFADWTPKEKAILFLGIGGAFFLNGVSMASKAWNTHAVNSPKNKHDIGMGKSLRFAGSALLRGTLWAIGGVGILSLVVWKATGVQSLPEFRSKVQAAVKALPIPALPKKENPGRSDFDSFEELLLHLEEEDRKKKKAARIDRKL